MEFMGRSVNMNTDERAALQEQFVAIDKNGDGYVDLSELKEALDCCGFKLPGWKVRQMIEEYDKRQMQHRGRFSFNEFEKMCLELKSN
jgi:plastin-3